MELGYLPSFCTACYSSGRTGERFMSLCKTGQIQNCCEPNAIMTLKEFLEDYASEKTKKIVVLQANQKLGDDDKKDIILPLHIKAYALDDEKIVVFRESIFVYPKNTLLK